jgi:hypothetical protein
MNGRNDLTAAPGNSFGSSFKLLVFCGLEIIFDTLLFFVLIVITVVADHYANLIANYFGAEHDEYLNVGRIIGKILLMALDFVIVVLFASKSAKEAFKKTWGA